jgi:hypothetical protein
MNFEFPGSRKGRKVIAKNVTENKIKTQKAWHNTALST